MIQLPRLFPRATSFCGHQYKFIRCFSSSPSYLSSSSSQNESPPNHVLKDDHIVIQLPPSSTSTSKETLPSRFHFVWLKDNCPNSIHPTTRQKLHSSGDIDVNTKPKSVEWIWSSSGSTPSEWELQIQWDSNDKSKSSRYPLSFLKQYNYSSPNLESKFPHVKPNLWTFPYLSANTSKAKELYFDANEVLNDDKALWRFAETIGKWGVGFVGGLEVKGSLSKREVEVEKLAKRFGCIRDTFYGKSWDVKSVKDSKNIAYTNLYLGLHMDLMYFEAPPGLQFLHCLQNTVRGGSSLFVDSFKAVDELRASNPTAYEILTTTPVSFHYINDGHHMHYRHYTITPHSRSSKAVAPLNDAYQVFYAPPFQGPLEIPEEKIIPFYKAFREFEKILRREDMLFEVLLKEGECAVFQNRRVLHGRREFDTSSGERWLKGTYVDWDDFKDKWRVLNGRYTKVSRLIRE
ncbi:hypothetical protein BKA69DRAFT_1091014 [Paraphysoderma sedebokerense]|nr:hypothetical protein BKA69DRAFT_1091014 [Paraphysoderma sedebokerense]